MKRARAGGARSQEETATLRAHMETQAQSLQGALDLVQRPPQSFSLCPREI